MKALESGRGSLLFLSEGRRYLGRGLLDLSPRGWEPAVPHNPRANMTDANIAIPMVASSIA
jgi:hypothetical protein